ncbi:PD-(D/E)XK nuclease family protein [Mucilaginibacter arboris]|uniref:Uncharacterized protein n=1 Tax=Mucilaginibacter arboris TaxID=2682090 RepID=A0A7K1T0S1_9SPHI|nr:hypothetical protein [Mucilaginibacter arboris]MVN23164.1 hypothetical protein [Mucilaginibacter arboris]
MREIVLKVVESDEFAHRLNYINRNYSNLKQENLIRNAVLELLNEKFLDNSNKAFAEHPREKGSKIDLSIVNDAEKDRPYSIEFKFQYTNDYKQFADYNHFIEKDFQRSIYKKQCDMFILIISSWDKDNKKDYDGKWGIKEEHSLSRFLSSNENWKTNVGNLFSNYSNVTLDIKEITVEEPYSTNYNLYIMSRD